MRVNLDNMAVVLHRPKYPENIGAAARAALNMGITRLIVVDPRDCDLTRILKLATHFAADLVENMDVHEDLGSALAPFHYIVGTTARVGSQRPTRTNVQSLAESLVSISQENRQVTLTVSTTAALEANETVSISISGASPGARPSIGPE